MKKLLITGAYGLVGSTICRLLEERYPDIEVTKIKGYVVNIGNENPDADYVIHAAGYGQPLKFTTDKLNTITLNTFDVPNMFKYLKPGGSFLYISTSELYSGAPGPHTEEMIGTTTPQHPRACYIESKRCGEAICMAYKEQGYDVKIARLALAYGPGTKAGDTRVLNQFIEQALTKKEITMRDDGSAKRTYVYVDDAAEMMLDVLFAGKDTVYNIGGISETTIYNLARTIGKICDVTVHHGTQPVVGAPDSVELDNTKILAEFPDRYFTKLYEGLEKTIAYQKTLYEA